MSPWIQNALVIAVPMLLLWLASVRLRDVSIVDVFWGLGFALIAVWTYFSVGAADTRSLLLTLVVAAWGTRLGLYLLWRNAGKGEDRRYQKIRAGYGERFWLTSLFIVFGFQGALIYVVALPVQWALTHAPGAMGPVQWIGLVVAVTGILIETTADLQLARFKSDPASRGRVLDTGLWRYSRHPNYFGDFVVWWGIFLLAYSGPHSLFTAVGPAIMTVFLLRVSGVSLLERDIGERRPAYADYIRRTSAFFPLPPKQEAS